MKARRKLDRRLKADKNKTDKYFSYYLTLRSEPVTNFLEQATPKSELPISSINEVSGVACTHGLCDLFAPFQKQHPLPRYDAHQFLPTAAGPHAEGARGDSQ